MEIDIEPTVYEVKMGLPISYVLFRAGVPVNSEGSAVCPFHEDHEPSLDTFAPNRWNCAPCGRGGDVLDLLFEFAPELKFPQRLEWAARLMREMEEQGWNGAAVLLEREPFDREAGLAFFAASHKECGWATTPPELENFRLAKGLLVPAEELHLNWGLGVSGGRLVIPYWSGGGALRTYRTRAVDGSDKPRSAPGVSEPTFYGEWRDRGLPLVVICEGESDTWATSFALGESADVLGVPGAGRPPFGAERLNGRRVMLAFDGDPAGRAAAERWFHYLASGVDVIYLPDGRDMASYSPEEIRALVQEAHNQNGVLPYLHD